MAVKTKKERAEEFKHSSPELKKDTVKEDVKAKKAKKEKIKMYLPQITQKGEYTLILNYKNKKEKIKSKNGIVEIGKEEIEKYKSCGFKMLADKKEDLGQYYCADYLDKSFNLELDDGTKIKVSKGIAEPKTKYEKDQLIKRYFSLYKLKK